ncbi:MAG TPA: ribonuclease III [Oscillospiraceae bacterium]|nr:ribonuclease III [Oscillospiraceae bacterium]
MELEEKLGYVFRDKSLLASALSHSSYANERKAIGYNSNERLEFLGDAVLGFVTADVLYRVDPALPEGRMTKLRAELVCETALHKTALELELGRYLRLGKGEEHTGGRERPSILADAVEAVIAALYLDGGFDVSRRFIMAHVLAGADIACEPTGDWKTELQEFIQQKPGRTLAYELLSESGPDHDKLFQFRVLLDDTEIGRGQGRTKKEAEQSAASAALEAMKK